MSVFRLIFVLLSLVIWNPAFSQWKVVCSGKGGDLVNGCFVDDSTGYVVSRYGNILKTSDGGKTWNLTATLYGTFTSICRAGRNTLYAGGDHTYCSNDGGKTWTLQSVMDSVVYDMDFFDSAQGYAIINAISVCIWGDGPHYHPNCELLETKDSGRTWKVKFGNNYRGGHFKVIDDSTAYFSGNYIFWSFHCLLLNYFEGTYRTENKGIQWYGTYYNYGNLFSFIDRKTGYFLDPIYYDSFILVKTTDGGINFMDTRLKFSDLSLKQLKFYNDYDGYFLADHTIYIQDSAREHVITDLYSSEKLNYLFCNSDYLFCAADNGFIFRKEIVTSIYWDTIYKLRASPDSLDFGFVNVDSSETRVLNLKNKGNMTLNLTVNAPDNYKVSFNDSIFSSQLKVSLNPLQDTGLYIQFIPTKTGNFPEELILAEPNMDTVRVSMTGNGFHGLNRDIDKDTVLCSDTIRIGNNIKIKKSACVTICPGTRVLIMGNFRITVEGKLRAAGDVSGNIWFQAADTHALWNGICIDNENLSDTTFFHYTNFTGLCNSQVINATKGNLEISHCNISNEKTCTAAVTFNSSHSDSKLVVKNSHFFNTRGIAIQCEHCNGAFISDNNIHDNDIGITFFSRQNFVIKNSTISHNKSGGILGGSNVMILNNKLFNNGGGINIWGAPARIENNEIFNNSSESTGGISCTFYDSGGVISQNLVFNNESIYGNGAGINVHLWNNPDFPAYIFNNTICNNKACTYGNIHNFYAGADLTPGLDLVVFNNIIYSNSDRYNSFRVFKQVNAQITSNCINQPDAGYQEPGNYYFNPGFVNPTDSTGVISNLLSYDWSLQANSFCIDAGDSLNINRLPLTDFKGKIRIFNKRVDLGAYEYQGFFKPGSDSANSPAVFPNPFSDLFYVLTPNADLTETIIYDIHGKVILKATFRKFTSVNMAGIPSGIYICEFRYEDGSNHITRIIKNSISD